MAILITVETVILALLAVLVAGLLRSHAEILRQLAGLTGGAAAARTPDPALPAAREGTSPAFDIAGATVAGETRCWPSCRAAACPATSCGVG